MNYPKYLLIALLFSFFLFGCGEKPGHRANDLSSSQQAMLTDSLQKLDSLILLTRTVKFDEAIGYANTASTIAEKLNTPDAFVKSCIMLGNVYFGKNIDSGFFYYNKALSTIDSFGLVAERVHVLYNLGMLHSSAGNHKTSIVLLDSALFLSKSIHDYVTMSNASNSLGTIYLEMGDEFRARRMFDTALNISKTRYLYLQLGTTLGNLAKFENDPDESIRINNEAINYLKKSNGSNEPIAQILINIGLKNSNPDSAILYYKKALLLVDSINAPEVVMGVYNNLAYSYLDEGRIEEAEKYIRDYALPIALSTNNLDWQSTIYDSYSDIFIRKKEFKKAIESEKKSMEIMGKANKQSAAKQIRLLAAMLDLKNKEEIIKDDKIQIDKANATLKTRNQWIIIILLAVIGLAGFLVIWLLRKRIQIQHQQIESAKKIIEAEENEKAKISLDLHDLTGQKFTSFLVYLENIEFLNEGIRSTALSQFREIKEAVREMSHRINKSWIERFTLEESIRGLCADILKMTNLNVKLFAPEIYPVMQKEVKVHVFRIIQELLSNAVKYAIKAEVILDISFNNNILLLKYSDNGPGFDKENVFKKGIGLNNLQERVSLLNGKIEIDADPGYGTYFEIRIPMHGN